MAGQTMQKTENATLRSTILNTEPISKRFSLVKVKAGEYFNRKNTLSILRVEI